MPFADPDRARQYQREYAQGRGQVPIVQVDFHQRRMDATNRRSLATFKSLAMVRKLWGRHSPLFAQPSR